MSTKRKRSWIVTLLLIVVLLGLSVLEPAALLTVVLLLGYEAFGYLAQRNFFLPGPFRRAELVLPVPSLCLGETGQALLRLEPRRPTQLKSAVFTFFSQETVFAGDSEGGNGTPVHHVVGEWETPLDLPSPLIGLSELSIDFPVARNTPVSLAGRRHRLRSACKVELQLESGAPLILETEAPVASELVP